MRRRDPVSIVAMMQEAAGEAASGRPTRGSRSRRGVRAQEPPKSTPALIAAGLTRYIPTEAVALYTAILPFLVPKGTPLDKQDFTSRWWLAIGVGVAAVLFSIGIYKRQ